MAKKNPYKPVWETLVKLIELEGVDVDFLKTIQQTPKTKFDYKTLTIPNFDLIEPIELWTTISRVLFKSKKALSEVCDSDLTIHTEIINEKCIVLELKLHNEP